MMPEQYTKEHPMAKQTIKPGFNIRRAGKDGKKFRVVTVAPNNEILATSEVLNTKQSALKNIRSQVWIARSESKDPNSDSDPIAFNDLTRKERRR